MIEMETVSLTINSTPVEAQKGEKILFAALDNGIYIPNLCAIRDVRPHAGCRLCFVEIEGLPEPVTACTEIVAQDMVVHTDGPRVRRLQRTAAELLIASHRVECGSCAANRRCELQKIASFLGLKLKPKRFRAKYRSLPVDDSHPNIIIDPNKCVLCGKCVWACMERSGIGAINYAFRGDRTIISAFGGDRLVDTRCDGGGLCAEVCPVGAIVTKNGGTQP